MQIFLISLKQVAILLIYILIGYIFCRKKIISKDSNKTLSKLLIFVFAPAYTIPSLIKGLDSDNILKYAFILLCGITVVVVSILFSVLISKMFSKDGFERNIYKYMFAFSNLGYFGYPLVKEVFGPEVLASFMLFTLPITITLNSYGYIILTSDGEKSLAKEKMSKKELLKRIFSVPFITSVIGITLGLMPFEMPAIFFDVLSPAGGCYSVTAMLIAGISLSSYSMKEMFRGIKPYFAGLVRLCMIPLILGGIVFGLYKIFDFDKTIVICTVAFAALPSGMNVAVFPEFAGKDGSIGAKACFISCIMALITIPIWFYLLSVLIPA